MLEVPTAQKEPTFEAASPVSGNGQSVAAPATTDTPVAQSPDSVAVPRPCYRAPMAILQILDDGRKSAELVRLRTENCVIGRTEGDVRIVHDLQISIRHAEIIRACQDGRHSWHLRDLDSTNGTYVRIKAALLTNDQDLIIGRHRFRFVAASAEADPEANAEEPPPVPDIRQTCCWQVAESSISLPKQHKRPHLVELLADGEGRRIPLMHDSEWIGRDGSLGPLAFPDDMTMNLRHARLYRAREDHWRIEDSGSANGVWLRIREIHLTHQASFMLGEQIFVIVFP
jgi:pSer/pThr/pTyr-binding forkhead associated (FHA) protein